MRSNEWIRTNGIEWVESGVLLSRDLLCYCAGATSLICLDYDVPSLFLNWMLPPSMSDTHISCPCHFR